MTVTERARAFVATCVPGEYARFTLGSAPIAEVYRYAYNVELFGVSPLPVDGDDDDLDDCPSSGTAEYAVTALVNLAFRSIERRLDQLLAEVRA